MESDKIRTSAFIVQTFSTIIIAYLTSLSGFVYAWPSYTLENFVSNQTVLSWPMSSGEISILGCITNIGALVVTPFCGYAIDTFGRKYAAMLFGLPSIIAWSTIVFTNYVPLVIAAVGIAGFGAAGQAASSVFIAEIVQDSIRGTMTSSTVAGYFLGLLFSYVLGGRLSYYQVVYAHLSLSVLYVLMLTLLKESPVFLMQKGREKEAAESVAFYRRVKVTSKEVQMEIRKIKLQLDPRIDEILHGDTETDTKAAEELIKKGTEIPEQVSSWKFLRKSESSQRALMTALILMAANIMMGAIVLQVYAEPLFKEAVPTMPSNLCAIFLAVDFLVASLLCSAVVDRFGRKLLMTGSSIASGIFTILIAAQLQFHYAPAWVTVFLIYAYCFVYNLGAAVVPFILTAEVFLPEVRGLCNSIVMACMWITNFVTLIIFNPLVENFGLGPIFYGFGVVCFLTSMYSHWCLPETKNLSADAIQLLFLKKRIKDNRV